MTKGSNGLLESKQLLFFVIYCSAEKILSLME